MRRKLCLLALVASVRLCAAADTAIVNGGFEMGDNTGWTSKFDGIYWELMDAKVSPTWVHDGDYSVTRHLFAGQEVATIDLKSQPYGDVKPGKTYKLSLNVRGIGDADKFKVFGAISFYSDADGKTLLAEFPSEQIASSKVGAWTTLNVKARAPDNASSFRMIGRISVLERIPDTSYAVFDTFDVNAVEEP